MGAGAFENLYCSFPQTILGDSYSFPLGRSSQPIKWATEIRLPTVGLQESHDWPLQTPRWDPRSIICCSSFLMLETHLKRSWEEADTWHNKGEQWVPTLARTVILLQDDPCPIPSLPSDFGSNVSSSCSGSCLHLPCRCHEVCGYSFSRENGIWSLLITHSGRKLVPWGWVLERTSVCPEGPSFLPNESKQVSKHWSPPL